MKTYTEQADSRITKLKDELDFLTQEKAYLALKRATTPVVDQLKSLFGTKPHNKS